MEHENRLFKERLKTFRGTFTQAHLDRVSRARSQITKMIRTLDEQIGHYPNKAAKTGQKDDNDVRMLTVLYQRCDLTAHTNSARVHSTSTCDVSQNLTAGMNGSSLKAWLLERLELCRIRNYYRQFSRKQHDSDGDDSFLNIMQTDCD